jgi:hypothetical protein
MQDAGSSRKAHRPSRNCGLCVRPRGRHCLGIGRQPTIFRSLVEQGYRDHLRSIAIAIGIAVSVVVLLIFLFLRKAMAGSGAPS